MGRLTALAARAKPLCLSVLVGSDDSGRRAMGQDEAGASARGPPAQGWKAEPQGACWESLQEEACIGPWFSMDISF